MHELGMNHLGECTRSHLENKYFQENVYELIMEKLTETIN